MDTIRLDFCRGDVGELLALFDQHAVPYRVAQRDFSVGVPMASARDLVSMIIENLPSVAMATAFAAWLGRNRGRKVIITTKEKQVIHIEGLSESEMSRFLTKATQITAIDSPEKNQSPLKDVHP